MYVSYTIYLKIIIQRNIVESGIKHHQTNKQPLFILEVVNQNFNYNVCNFGRGGTVWRKGYP